MAKPGSPACQQFPLLIPSLVSLLDTSSLDRTMRCGLSCALIEERPGEETAGEVAAAEAADRAHHAGSDDQGAMIDALAAAEDAYNEQHPGKPTQENAETAQTTAAEDAHNEQHAVRRWQMCKRAEEPQQPVYHPALPVLRFDC